MPSEEERELHLFARFNAGNIGTLHARTGVPGAPRRRRLSRIPENSVAPAEDVEAYVRKPSTKLVQSGSAKDAVEKIAEPNGKVR